MFLGQAISDLFPRLHDKWLSFIPSPAAPWTNGIWHFIRGGPQPVLRFHPKKHHSGLLGFHLDVCRPHRGQRRTLDGDRQQPEHRFLGFQRQPLGLLPPPKGGG